MKIEVAMSNDRRVIVDGDKVDVIEGHLLVTGRRSLIVSPGHWVSAIDLEGEPEEA